jgi:hypothetical protein
MLGFLIATDELKWCVAYLICVAGARIALHLEERERERL